MPIAGRYFIDFIISKRTGLTGRLIMEYRTIDNDNIGILAEILPIRLTIDRGMMNGQMIPQNKAGTNAERQRRIWICRI